MRRGLRQSADGRLTADAAVMRVSECSCQHRSGPATAAGAPSPSRKSRVCGAVREEWLPFAGQRHACPEMSCEDSAVLLPPSGCDKNLLDEKLRSLIRTSEINLTRIPAVQATGGLSCASGQSPASPAANSKHTITISITSSASSQQSVGSVALNCNPAADIRAADEAVGQSATKKKKKKRTDTTTPVVQQHVIYAAPATGPRNGSLFRHRLDESSDEDECSDDEVHDESSLCLPAITFISRDTRIEQDLGELRLALVSQKWLLSRWINLKRKQLYQSATEVRRDVEREMKRSVSAMSKLLEESGSHSTIRKGVCCFSTDDFVCSKSSLPYTRHCKEHILYNVDQLLFTRCTAKSATSLTQCSCPTFDIEHDDPICDYHTRRGVDDVRDVSGKAVRKRTKQMALTRPARRKKRKGVDNMTQNSDKMPPPPPYPTSLADSDIPAALDVGIPNLGPGDEALVASLVADLGPLPLGAADHSSSAFDAELTDVLSKMPVDAFHELFADHPIKGSASETDAVIDQPFSSKGLPTGDATYPFMPHASPAANQMNGHMPPVHSSPRPLLTPLPNDDLVNNILGFLTTEQQQQLNGLIDGALASGSLTSPTLKSSSTVQDSFVDVPPLQSGGLKSANLLPVSQLAEQSVSLSAPFAQFAPRPIASRMTASYVPFTPTTGSLLITGLNEASIGRSSNQFVKLTDIGHNHQPQSSIKNCIPRPHAHQLATTLNNKSSR